MSVRSYMKIISRRAATQRVVKGKQGETIDVLEGSGLLITGCKNCTVNAPGRNTNVTIERCQDTAVRMGSVVASLEVIHCTAVDISVQRCRTITVDVSTKVALCCTGHNRTGVEKEGERKGGEEQKSEEAETSTTESAATRIPEAGVSAGAAAVADAKEEASSIRLFTSSSDEVSITFAGVLVSSSACTKEGGSASTVIGDDVVIPVTYNVPKDGKYKKGDDRRSLSRITFFANEGSVDVSGGGYECKTLRCDQYGTPLEEVEAIAAGVPWTWEHGQAGGGQATSTT